VDHLIAEQLNAPGQGPLAFMAGPSNTYIGEGLSWSGPRMRTPAERSPFNAYTRLTGLASAPPAVQLLVAQRRKSVNDLVRTQLSALQSSPQLSASDKARLKLHAESVRDMEVRMTCDLEPTTVTAVKAIPNNQVEGNAIRPEVVKRFMDVAAWAFNCGLNHAVTLQVGEGNDGTEYTINGTKLPRFHWISHRIYADGADGEPIANAIDLHHSIVVPLGLRRHPARRLGGRVAQRPGHRPRALGRQPAVDSGRERRRRHQDGADPRPPEEDQQHGAQLHRQRGGGAQDGWSAGRRLRRREPHQGPGAGLAQHQLRQTNRGRKRGLGPARLSVGQRKAAL
jgi:hypothetical protein